MNHYIIPVFISHLGCPHTCVFCNQSRITEVSRAASRLIRGRDVLAIAKEYLGTMPQAERTVELSFFGGTFTGLAAPLQEELLEAARSLREAGQIDRIRCSTRPDFIDAAVLERLAAYGLDIIELGVQSLDDEVLRLSGRGHDAKQVAQASRLIRAAGFTLGHQLMPGLPGATPSSDLESARQSIALGPAEVRLYPTLVVRDTPLANLYAAGTFRPYSLETAVDLTGDLMALYEAAGIRIIRVGLQATDEIAPGASLLGGPYHPAFRELVLSRRLNGRLAKAAPSGCAELVVNPRDLSVLYADKKRYFKAGQDRFRVTQDASVPRGQIMVRRQEGDLVQMICI